MITITPTRRSWITPARLVVAALLLATSSSVLLMLTGLEAPAMACLAAVA